jgi:protein involved in polysaccharide export with SLBB domain
MATLCLLAGSARSAEAGAGSAYAGAARLQGTGASSAAVPVQPARSNPEVTSQTTRATRAELTAALERFERAATQGAARDRSRAQTEAAAIRARLRNGDFRVGDRLSLSVSGDTVSRELAVREGNQIELPYGIPPLTLDGVLRSELSDAVSAHLRKYVREPDVRVRVLQRINVTGAVGRPGVYWVQPDMPLAEILMRAGGPGTSARLDRIEVVRGNRTVIDRKAYARLVREGRTVEESSVLPGDEIRVQERTGRNWSQIATYSFFAISALTAALALIRSSYQ